MNAQLLHIRRATADDAEGVSAGQGVEPVGAALLPATGFVECGRLRAQVVIDGRENDEIVIECFLTPSQPAGDGRLPH